VRSARLTTIKEHIVKIAIIIAVVLLVGAVGYVKFSDAVADFVAKQYRG
jgi:hypothetical protein